MNIALKITVLLGLTFLPFLIYQYKTVPETDPYYHSATHQTNVLITGLSRAKRGIAPAILEKTLELNQSPQNIAFDGLNSPYGKKYYDFILKKVDRQKKGLFILSVSPPSIMDRHFEKQKGNRENHFFIYNLFSINNNPNFEYLIRSYPTYSGFNKETKDNNEYIQTIYHDSGWWETNVHSDPGKQKINKKKSIFLPSTERENYLKKTIESLKKYGNVVLVRLPISEMNYQTELKWCKQFDQQISQIANTFDVPYLNYAKQHEMVNFFDFKSHMDGISSKKFTKILAKDIEKYIDERDDD